MEKVKSSEIMLGNWFIGYDGKPFKWGIEHFANLATVYLDEIVKSPIPLTEEILLKCGFRRKYQQCYLVIQKVVDGDPIIIEFEIIGKDIFGSLWIGVWDDYTKVIRLDIKYFHQLQNLYFVVTGKELEIKL